MSDEGSFYEQMRDIPIGGYGALTFVSKRTWEYGSFSVYKKVGEHTHKLIKYFPIPGKVFKEINLSLKELELK
jgi:hypothetical protein